MPPALQRIRSITAALLVLSGCRKPPREILPPGTDKNSAIRGEMTDLEAELEELAGEMKRE